ncbi:integration host factor subunit alpha [Candidatus Providencia siddallii]|uniref:Integration host factor subunit alpha n=1 Tax=Candidatus Providencia siddallii TaxID=1715285 RepID=A0ABM9NPQ5_9GAMM
MSITKHEISKNLFKKLGLSKSSVKNIIEIFFEEIKFSLEKGIIIKLSGFGNFILQNKKQRPGRNPKTGEYKTISARKIVSFRPGMKLKNQIEKTIVIKLTN